jgi:hypothetical protein
MHFLAYFFWVGDSVEGFTSDAVIDVELLYSSRTLFLAAWPLLSA